MKQEITVNSINSLDSACLLLSKLFSNSKYLTLRIDTGKPRSGNQNNALHLYCAQLSKSFNDAGLDMTQVLSHHAEIPWDQRGYNVKERVWKPVQEALTQKKSTTQPNTAQYPEIYETVNRYTTSKHGIYVPWPSKEQSQ